MNTMRIATGPFEVTLTPQAENPGVSDATIARMSIDKNFQGELDGVSKGQMLGVRSAAVKGSGGYVALERVVGTLAGKKGSFVLQHSSTMKAGVPTQSILVVPDSGTEELTGLSGAMTIDVAPGGRHSYRFEYSL